MSGKNLAEKERGVSSVITRSFLVNIPSGITTLRCAIAPLFLYTIISGMETWTKGLFLLAIATDLADGYLARRLGVSSNLGAYFDATADFFVIMSSFAAFAIIALYPAWLLIIIASMFTQFLVTSRFGKPVYDPIGRHYGTFLFAAIGLTLAFPSPPLWLAISDIITILTIAAITSRCIALFNREVGAEHSQKQLSEAIR